MKKTITLILIVFLSANCYAARPMSVYLASSLGHDVKKDLKFAKLLWSVAKEEQVRILDVGTGNGNFLDRDWETIS